MSSAVASLGMYDHPAQRDANDALWTAIVGILRANGVDAPASLERTSSMDALWREPGLLLGQACGYPLVSDPDLDLRVVAVPVYHVPGCRPERHFSHIVVRHDDSGRVLQDYVRCRAAVNSAGSNSGYNLFRAVMAHLAIDGRAFAAVITTGSHRASALAVRDGGADMAAVDAVTWAALARYEPEALAGLRIVASTPSSPALPFVTARTSDKALLALLRTALSAVAADPALAGARDALFLTDIRPASIHRFAEVHRLARDAAARGYPVLQ